MWWEDAGDSCGNLRRPHLFVSGPPHTHTHTSHEMSLGDISFAEPAFSYLVGVDATDLLN